MKTHTQHLPPPPLVGTDGGGERGGGEIGVEREWEVEREGGVEGVESVGCRDRGG